MRIFLAIFLTLGMSSALAANDCSMTLEGKKAVALEYQYAVQLSDPASTEEPALVRLVCTQNALSDEQLFDWSKFREAFHAADNQGFYIQFQDELVVVVGATGLEENFSSAGFPDLKFDGEMGAEKFAGTLSTSNAPSAYDDSMNWTIAATIDLKPVAAW